MTQTVPVERVRLLLRVAWLAVLLGIAVQLPVFAVRLAAGHGPAPVAKLIGLGGGELVFPIGCALVIYAPVHMRRFAGLA